MVSTKKKRIRSVRRRLDLSLTNYIRMITENFYSSIIKLFSYYKSLGEKTFSQLEEKELFLYIEKESNSIAIIVNHLEGNMLSRWTDFLNSDGEQSWRNRDQEFAEKYKNRQELLIDWNKGWDCLFLALEEAKKTPLDHIIYIRNQGHTIIEAIHRQLTHYAYHIGQIVFLGKMIKSDSWQNLSIPKNASEIYNEDKFMKEKSRKHFTEDL